MENTVNTSIELFIEGKVIDPTTFSGLSPTGLFTSSPKAINNRQWF